MNNSILLFSALLFLSACSSDNEHAANAQVQEERENYIPTPTVRIQTEEDRALEAVQMAEYRVYLVEISESPWITKNQTIAFDGEAPVPLPPELVIERRAAGMALSHLNAISYHVPDDHKVLVKMTGDIGVVTVEAKLPQNSLGPAFAVRVTVNPHTGEIFSIERG